MSKPIPLAILSDSVDCSSGLARITRDLASRIYKNNLGVRLATIGFNGCGSSDFPWQQYCIGSFGSAVDIPKLMPAWLDFTKGESGILLTIFDIPRLEAFRFPKLYGQEWLSFLASADMSLWGYFPIDSHAPKGLTKQSAEVLRAFDRTISYGPYGQAVIDQALAGLSPKLDHKVALTAVSHGIDTSTFMPRGKLGLAHLKREIDLDIKTSEGFRAKRTLEVKSEDLLLGVNATNQMRKDWGSTFEIFGKLSSEWKFWLHTDRLFNYWNIPDLVEQFGLNERVFITQPPLEDKTLAELYSACTVTFAPGLGEGFGYPIVESMACGTPCVHTGFAGGADLYGGETLSLLVPPIKQRIEGAYCLYRPIIDVDRAATLIQNVADKRVVWEKLVRAQAENYSWSKVWPYWESHLKALLKDYRDSRRTKESIP